jgi:4-hydroxymandelate oxidase
MAESGAEERARAVLEPDVFDYYAGGAGDQTTRAANVAAWDRIVLRPRVLRDVAAVDTRTTLLGTGVATPIGLAPTAFHGLADPEGEAATAAAARDGGTLLTLSTRSSRPVEDVATALGPAPWWFQVYVLRDRGRTRDLVERATAAGARALVLTGDTPFLGPRRTYAPAAVRPEEPAGQEAPDITFDDIAWLREVSGGLPIVVKGVLRADDARTCAASGAAAVWVSNHGGRQLDGAVATVDALPEVAGTGVETYVDGGVRRGVDVLRGLALGARAVFIGRPVLWALAAGGAEGVRGLLSGLNADLELSMALAGAPAISDVTPDLVWTPPAGGIR